MTRTRKLAAWLWPTGPRHPSTLTVKRQAADFGYRLAIFGALGAFLFACWFTSTEAYRPRDENGNAVHVVIWPSPEDR
jgi:hypothetical protein